uniref:Uncharacterized protein n=1 Tax=Arundo donax TaxID=35708 RepID=A0A0A9CSJ4_ARUDO
MNNQILSSGNTYKYVVASLYLKYTRYTKISRRQYCHTPNFQWFAGYFQETGRPPPDSPEICRSRSR